MAWWFFILAPGTFRLLYDFITICFIALCTYQPSRLGELKEKTAHWYLGFSRLRPKELKMFDRVRMSRETQKKVRKWLMYVESLLQYHLLRSLLTMIKTPQMAWITFWVLYGYLDYACS
jgi:hypothetical protein